MTIANTITSSATVVSASFERSPVMISTAATAVVNRIATQGVRRFSLIVPSGAGTTSSFAIP